MRIPNYTKGLVVRRDVANNVDLGQIAAAGAIAGGAANVLDVGTQVAQKIKQSNDMSAVNTAVIEDQKNDVEFNNTFRQENQDDPIGYANKAAELRKARTTAVAGNLQNEDQREAFNLTAERQNIRSYQSDISWENKRSIQKLTNDAERNVGNLTTMAASGEIPLKDLRDNLGSTAMSMGGVLAKDQIEKVIYQGNQAITKSWMNGQIDRNPYEAKKLMDSQEYNQSLGAQNTEVLNNKVDREIKYRRKAQAAAEKKAQTQFIENPAQLAVDKGAQSPQAIVDTQIALGVQTNNLSVIPNAEAKSLVNKLNGINRSDELISEMNALKEEYGDRYYSMAMGDLKEHGLSSEKAFIALMNPQTDKLIMDAAFNMGAKGAEFKKIAKDRDVDLPQLSRDVEEAIQDTREVLAQEGQDVSSMSAFHDIALYFTSQGSSSTEAVKQATDWFMNDIKIGKIRDSLIDGGDNFRVPTDYNVDEIEDALEIQIDNLGIFDLATRGTGKADLESLQENGRFVLGHDETYYWLKNASGEPVRENNATNILKFDIIDILEQSENKSKKEQKQRLEELITSGAD